MRRANIVIFIGFTLYCLGATHVKPASAGFEWKPAPAQPNTQTRTPIMKSVPVVTDQSANKPIMLELEDIEAEPPQTKAEPKKEISKPIIVAPTKTSKPVVEPRQPVVEKPAPIKTRQMIINPYPEQVVPTNRTPVATASPATADHQTTDNEIVQGFGSDIPLAFALSQVVPAHYSYAFGDNVNPGYRVSWNGGRPWQTIVTNMIKPLGLEMRIHDNKLVIEKQGTTLKAPTSAAAIEKPAIVKTEPKVVIKRGNIVDPGPTSPATHSQAPSTGGPQMLIKSTSNDNDIITEADEDRPLAPPQQSRVWKAEQGKSLRSTLGSWSNQVNVGMVWNASQDPVVSSNLVVNGNYNDAINTLMTHGINGGTGITHSLLMHEGSDVAKTLIIQDRS